jgi:ABC-type nickel/cobalt efflux system permease component RcnA
MTRAGWTLMIVSWSVILFWTVWCFRRVLLSKRHWTHPEDDITQLRHGEFGDDPKA